MDSVSRRRVCVWPGLIAFGAVSGFSLAHYLMLRPMWLFSALLGGLTVLCSLRPVRAQRLSALTAIYALLLGSVMIMGSKLHIESPYDGLSSANFFLPFSPWDAPGLAALTAGLYVISCSAHEAALMLAPRFASDTEKTSDARRFLGVFALIFLLWLPYLLAYFPGYYFADTENPVLQAVGVLRLNNRNPILYTLFIRLCIALTGGFESGDLTAACALYSVVQMLFFSACLSYTPGGEVPCGLTLWARFSGCRPMWRH